MKPLLCFFLLVLCSITTLSAAKTSRKKYVSISNKARSDATVDCSFGNENLKKILKPDEKIRWVLSKKHMTRMTCHVHLQDKDSADGYFPAFPEKKCERECRWRILDGGAVQIKLVDHERWEDFDLEHDIKKKPGKHDIKHAPAPTKQKPQQPEIIKKKPGKHDIKHAPAPQKPQQPEIIKKKPGEHHTKHAPAPTTQKPQPPKNEKQKPGEHSGKHAPAPIKQKPQQPKNEKQKPEEHDTKHAPAPTQQKPGEHDTKHAPAPTKQKPQQPKNEKQKPGEHDTKHAPAPTKPKPHKPDAKSPQPAKVIPKPPQQPKKSDSDKAERRRKVLRYCIRDDSR